VIAGGDQRRAMRGEGRGGAADVTLEASARASVGDDGALAGRVETALAEDGRIADASRILVSASGGVVDLRGTVGSDYERRLAADICRPLPGVAAVRNELTVGGG
jgi:osmotically-inducible protein OsmY